MLGSGTTLVEAQRLGRRAIGCDIDPLARLMAKVKLTPLDPIAALQAGRSVLRGARQDVLERQGELENNLAQRFDEPSRKFVDYWFLPERQLELAALLDRVDQVDDEPLRDFLRVVVSSTIIAKSGGVSLARDLAHTRPHRVLAKKPRSAFAEFQKKLDNNVGGLRTGRRAPRRHNSRPSRPGHRDVQSERRPHRDLAALREQRDRLHAGPQVHARLARLQDPGPHRPPQALHRARRTRQRRDHRTTLVLPADDRGVWPGSTDARPRRWSATSPRWATSSWR